MSLLNEGFAIRRNGTCLGGLEVDCGATREPFHACCPTGYQCPGTQFNVICCRDGDKCRGQLEASSAAPCANATWNLYDNGGYFCCAPGTVAYNRTNSNGCALPNLVPANVQTLSLIRAGVDAKTFVSSASASSIATSNALSATTTGSVVAQTSGPDSTSDKGKSGADVGAIAGGVVGGVLGLALITFLVWFFLRKKRGNAAELQGNNPYESHDSHNSGVADAKYRHEIASHDLYEADGTSMRTAGAELPASQPHHQPPVELDGTARGAGEKS